MAGHASQEVPMMAGPGDEMSAGAGGRGHLRASHADRERVIGVLKTAFIQGMLAKDELDLRVGQTLASRTYADLAALTADLPAGLPPARSPRPARAQGRKPVVRPGRVIAVSTGLYAGAWGYALFLSPHGGNNTWAPPLLLQGFMVYLGVLLICVGAILVSRQDRRSGGQPPQPPDPPRRPDGSGPPSRRLPPAGPGRQFPGGALAAGPVPATG
ncbi:MAG TPA: DUF1707 domain-containing protein [Trebonia sp.]|nr:DUF1707 domain-containing protein [Trebonia sp.]